MNCKTEKLLCLVYSKVLRNVMLSHCDQSITRSSSFQPWARQQYLNFNKIV